MAYPWLIHKVKDLISGLAATNSNVSSNASAISTLTPTPPPVGGIIDYYGSLDTSGKYPMSEDGHINYNWHVCDGTDGTPNLVGKTIIGASKDTYGNEGGSDTVTPSVTVNSATQSVSVNGHTLTIDEMPAHAHDIRAGWPRGDSNPSGIDVMEYNQYNENRGFINNMLGSDYIIYPTGSTNSHSHGVTTSEHTHSLAISSFDNRSSFKALYKIMRLA